MTSFESTLSPAQRIVLAIDTSDELEAEKLAALAKSAGGRFIKFGLQLATTKSWHWCAELAKKHELEWIADAKLDDIPNTVEAAIGSLAELDHKPFGITIHATIGQQGMAQAQQRGGQINIFGVTVLTSLSDEETRAIFGGTVKDKVLQLAEASAAAGLAGLVASPQEVSMIKTNSKTKDLLTLIPGSRSAGTRSADQARVTTPAEAIKAGADLLVIGRQITLAKDPASAFAKIIKEIEEVS